MGSCMQAEKDLQPWIARDDEQGQKMWRVNQRIVKLIAELMRNHDSPEALIILASASDLLLRATDGMLVDGEACTLPQLEVTSIHKLSSRVEHVTYSTCCQNNIAVIRATFHPFSCFEKMHVLMTFVLWLNIYSFWK
jgi:GIGANTEA protein